MKDFFGDGQELFLDKNHKKLGGVCAGVAEYLDVPRFWMRVVAVIGLFVHAPSVLIAYGLAYLVLEERSIEDELMSDDYTVDQYSSDRPAATPDATE